MPADSKPLKASIPARRYAAAISAAILAALPSAAAALTRPLCNGYVIESEKIIRFNANERKLICGDPNAESWKEIPRFQAEYFIRTFLQQRGYFYPEFREKDGVVTILPGGETRITEIEVGGSPPPAFKVRNKRGIRGGLLTPGALDTLESWSKSRLRNEGYACPRVTSEADAESGHVRLRIEPGERLGILEVIEEPVENLRPGALRRFDAFRIGGVYDHQNLALTSMRIAQDGILQSSYFLTDCAAEGVRLTQKSMPGAKRMVSVGFGASTEEYFIVKAAWKQSRIGKNGSSFQVGGRGSYRRQKLLVQGAVYPFPFPTRWHFKPTFRMRKDNQSRYNYLAHDALVPAAYSWDTQNTSFKLAFGPKLDYTRTFKGAQKGWSHFLSGVVSLDITSHDYEYFLADPRSGYMMSANMELSSDKALSSVTAQKFGISGKALWNIAGYDPPLLIFAVRGSAASTLADYDGAGFDRLPPQFFNYLGGSLNMRGFSRVELPRGDRGALSALCAGAELRLANLLPLNLQPIVFADIGALGQRSFSIDAPGYWSPGLGLRWPSFIGVMRFTVARGMLIRNRDPDNDRLSHWQFYFALGEEF